MTTVNESSKSKIQLAGYEKILREIELSKAYQQSNTATEIAKNLAEVKTALMRKVSTLEDLTNKSKPDLLGGGQFTIHVESKPYKGERIPTYAAKTRPTSKQRKIDTTTGGSASFQGAPFNVKSQRFISAGPHPRHYKRSGVKPPKYAATQISPNMYQKIDTTDMPETDKQVELESRMGWKGEHATKDFVITTAQMEMKKAQREVEEKRGPGLYYNPNEIEEDYKKRPAASLSSKSGRMAGDAPLSELKWGRLHRVKLRKSMTNPGPGTYRINHDPYQVNREGDCMFDSSLGHRDPPIEGADLPPGLYMKNGCLNMFDRKTISIRGPYDLFSGSRYDPLNTGTSHILKPPTTYSYDKTWLAPGMYKPNWEMPCLRKAAKKSEVYNEEEQRRKLARHPPLYPVNRNPGPGSYEMERKTGERKASIAKQDKTPSTTSAYATAKLALWRDKFGFMSSTKKRDKITYNKWGYSPLSIGPARYRIVENPNINGHTNVFVSTSQRRGIYNDAPADRQYIIEKKQDAFNRTNRKLEEIRHQMRSHDVLAHSGKDTGTSFTNTTSQLVPLKQSATTSSSVKRNTK